jgi:hypothetical protein
MSELSYQQNLRRGVVGATCLLASFDRISEIKGITPQTYERYDKLRLGFVDACPDDNMATFVPKDIVSEYREVTKTFYSELGVETPRNVVYDRADSVDGLSKRLGELSTGGFRTCLYLDTDGLHAVGLLPIGNNKYNVRSTWSPFGEDDPVEAGDLFDYLDIAPRIRKRENSSRKTEKTSNITALPAEPRR